MLTLFGFVGGVNSGSASFWPAISEVDAFPFCVSGNSMGDFSGVPAFAVGPSGLFGGRQPIFCCYRWEPKEDMGDDVRFKNYGVAPKSAADFAFLLHGFHFLKDQGVMAIILPHGVLFRGGVEERIRTQLLKEGYIDTVIGLTIVVLRDKQGRAHLGGLQENRLTLMLRTLEAASAWPIEAEEKALKKLAGLIRRDLFELYVLTGHYTETSKRSQVTYIFRKGRPTIAIREDDEFTTVLCALCLHPIGYYGDTWVGVMCPTDEVIAHLLMMRGSEQKFWANANQHSPDRPQAGI